MELITTDNETHLIRPGQAAPRLVCLGISEGPGHADVIHRRDSASYRAVRGMLEGRARLGGHNLPFDLAVWAATWPDLLPLVFEMLDSDRLEDTQHRQKLLDIADGTYRGEQVDGAWQQYKYNLADVAKRYNYPVDLDKDTWRLRWHEFEDVPVKRIPQGAIEYLQHDVWAPRWILERQAEADVDPVLVDRFRRGRAAFALQLISVWGVRTDSVMVRRYRERTQARLDAHRELLMQKVDVEIAVKKKGVTQMVWVQEPFIQMKPDGTFKRNDKVMQAYAEAHLENPVRTPAGKISMSEDAVSNYTEDPVFAAFQEYSSSGTVMGKVEEWERGVKLPIHTHFDELMKSGRTSSSNPNIQARYAGNQPTDPKFGDRECMVPRKGNVFLICDVPGLELSTIAQKCIEIIGYSRLAEDLNAGNDPHSRVAAQILGISYEEAVRRKEDPNDEEIYLARQTGKIMNFGRDAMAGAKTIVIQARQKYGIKMTLEEAKKGINAHGEAYPEVLEFHKWIYSLCGNGGYATITHLYSDRVSGWLRPTEACNTFSQGLGADATLAALYQLVKVCYIGPGALHGSRVADYVHDEYITETAECDLDAKANHMGDVLTDEINKWLPNVPIKRKKMQPYASRRWSKLAHKVTNPDGTLGVWEWDEAIKAGSKGHAD
jgi:hypothetical protein